MDARTARTRAAVLTAGRDLLTLGGLEAVTHLAVAGAAGVGRRTVYRHWPARQDLLHDVLASTSAPSWQESDDLITDVREHLRQLREALVHGPLALVTAALAERSEVDPSYRPLRDRLAASGCAPLRERLTRAAAGDELPPDTDVDVLLARLEGPLFYEVLVRGVDPSDALLEEAVRSVEQA